MRDRQGLSLVELLVVLAILATLFTLTLGALQSARRNVDRARCASNLHQLGVATELYRDAHGSFPKAVSFPILPEDITLRHTLDPFIDSTPQVLRCPVDDVHFPEVGLSYEYNAVLADKSWSHAIANIGSAHLWVQWDADPFHAAPFSYCARNILFADGHVAQ